jgi:competence protein ComEC
MRSWMIGIVLGLLPVGFLPVLPTTWVYLALLLVAVGLPLCPLPGAKLIAGCALGLLLGLISGHDLLARRLPEACVREPLWASGTVSSLPRRSTMPDGSSRQRFEFTLSSLVPARCAGPDTILLSYYGPAALVPGQRWRMQVLLKRPWGLANPGSFNMQAWYAQSGIDATGSVRRDTARQQGDSTDLAQLHHRLRWKISNRIAELGFDARVSAMLRALTVADKSGIDSALWHLLQLYGVNHLLVISGLHIGLVAGVAHLLGQLLVRLPLPGPVRRVVAPPVLSLAAALGYCALAGFSLATQRALCMLVCFVLAAHLGRNSGSANNLLLAALLVLLLNPLAPLGSGFWLSFGAVASLLWLARWSRGRRWWWRAGATHLFMSLVMLPLGAWWFGGSSLVAAPANMLMVPLVGLVVAPVALLATSFLLLSLPGEASLWQLAAWPLQQLLPLADQLASSGEGLMYRYLAPSAAELVTAMLGLALLVLPLGTGHRALAGLMILPLLLPTATAPRNAGQLTRVTVLDVGQGTAVIVQQGGRALLYDTGGGDPAGLNMASSVILPYLRAEGLFELDTLVVSHQDLDHSAGTDTLLASLPVRRFRYGGERGPQSPGRSCRGGESWRWPGGPAFVMLAPDARETLAGNDGSCVLLVIVDGVRLLLPGDIEADRERQLVQRFGDALGADWLLAGHHGSLTSSSHAWLKTVQPATVVFSSAYASRFGHPHPLVVERVAARGVNALATATSGALIFEFAPGKPMKIVRYRQRVRRFWM